MCACQARVAPDFAPIATLKDLAAKMNMVDDRHADSTSYRMKEISKLQRGLYWGKFVYKSIETSCGDSHQLEIEQFTIARSQAPHRHRF